MHDVNASVPSDRSHPNQYDYMVNNIIKLMTALLCVAYTVRELLWQAEDMNLVIMLLCMILIYVIPEES